MYRYQDEHLDFDPLDKRDAQIEDQREHSAEPCPCCGRLLPRAEWCVNDDPEEDPETDFETDPEGDEIES